MVSQRLIVTMWKIKLISLICYLTLTICSLADDVNQELMDIKPFLNLNISGDIMILKLVYCENRIILQNPIILQEPYFEGEPNQYGIIDYKIKIKSCLSTEGKSFFSERNLGYMVFSVNNLALFIPANNFSHNDITQWHGIRGYAAYMEKSDVVFWTEKEANNSTLRLRKHHTLVWSFPFLKSKYNAINVYWKSEKTKSYAMSFFRNITHNGTEIVSWRLFSKKGELYGWEE